MAHRGPFQPRTFCDSVIWGRTEALSENGWEEAGASLGQKPQREGAEPRCRQLEKDLVRGAGKDAGGGPGWSGLAVSGQEVVSSRFFWPKEKLEGHSESSFLAHDDSKLIFWIRTALNFQPGENPAFAQDPDFAVFILPRLMMQNSGGGQVPGRAQPSLAAPWAPLEMWGCRKLASRPRARGPSPILAPPDPAALAEAAARLAQGMPHGRRPRGAGWGGR